MQSRNKLLAAAESYIANFFKNRIGAEYVFHDYNHTKNVVHAVIEISEKYNLTPKELEVLQLGAWFHDTGYNEGREKHEERSCENLRKFLQPYDYPSEELAKIEACILATRIPQVPQNLLQEIICDADLSHLGKNIYWDRCGRVRQELLMTNSLVMSEQEWVNFELEFMNNHKYHTPVAQELYGKTKERHIKQLLKQQERLNPKALESVEDLAIRDKKKKKKKRGKKGALSSAIGNNDNEIKDMRLGRGVETMYRTTYRTHVNLSSIADNKANIMLSINAIIISIVLSTMVPKFAVNPKLVIPTFVLLIVCLIAMVFAVLSTRPKITEGKFTREDIEKKRSNLLFFGNFYNMKLEDFHWGMTEMIKDSDFLYSSMTRDLYFLGVVLAKKYRYLSICYNVFMYGLIVTVITFALSFLL